MVSGLGVHVVRFKVMGFRAYELMSKPSTLQDQGKG